MTVLVVAPHPDDAEYGAGGLLAGLTGAGVSATVACFTPGPEFGIDPVDEEISHRRTAEAERAAELLGVSVHWLPRRRIEDMAEGVQDVVAAIRAARPEVVVTVDPDDLHPFHAEVARWTERAVFCSALATVGPGPDLALPYPPQLWYIEAYTTRLFVPDHYVDVTPWFTLARRALLAHETGVAITPGLEHQMRASHLRSGCAAAVPYAEGVRLATGYGQQWSRPRSGALGLLARLDAAAHPVHPGVA
jgi:LmbE family N-acetylglucosaminyl deacetylase